MVEIRITMDERGQVQINGPVDNKVLCLGILEFAKGLIQAHKPSVIETVAEMPALRKV